MPQIQKLSISFIRAPTSENHQKLNYTMPILIGNWKRHLKSQGLFLIFCCGMTVETFLKGYDINILGSISAALSNPVSAGLFCRTAAYNLD